MTVARCLAREQALRRDDRSMAAAAPKNIAFDPRLCGYLGSDILEIFRWIVYDLQKRGFMIRGAGPRVEFLHGVIRISYRRVPVDAGPPPLLGALDESRSYGIEVDVANQRG